MLHLAETFGLPCELQSFGFPLGQYANLQLMLTTHACHFFEAPFPRDDFIDDLAAPPPVVDGFVGWPALAGLGHGVELEGLKRAEPMVEASL
jgi:hypothetical protein